ncbi:UNVERIFIED_CONTAM: hypothetical protein K2H54_015225 [Gekko kuhli]
MESKEERFGLFGKVRNHLSLPAPPPPPETEQSSWMGLLARNTMRLSTGDGQKTARGVPAITTLSPAKLPPAAFSKGMYMQKFVIVFPSLVIERTNSPGPAAGSSPCFFFVNLSGEGCWQDDQETVEPQVERIHREMQS